MPRPEPNPSKKVLEFIDEVDDMEVCRDDNSEWPLTITIGRQDGIEARYIQSYSLNDNELFALFNLITDVLKSRYKKKLTHLEESNDYSNLHE